MCAIAVVSCHKDIAPVADYNVTLSKDNTYVEGDPITFKFSGSVDNILFYSGETGHEYSKKAEGDTGSIIKNQENYLEEYSFTYSGAGSFTATFVGTSVNYKGAEEKIKTIQVTIMPRF